MVGKKIRRRIIDCDTWRWYALQILVSISKITGGDSHTHSFMFCQHGAVFIQRQSCRVETETRWSKKPKIFTIWPFPECLSTAAGDHPECYIRSLQIRGLRKLRDQVLVVDWPGFEPTVYKNNDDSSNNHSEDKIVTTKTKLVSDYHVLRNYSKGFT